MIIMRMGTLVPLVLIAASFLISAWAYPQLPESVAVHWNVAGEADGYAPATWAVLLIPLLGIVLFALFLAIPRIDPLKKNIRKFESHYEGLVMVIMAFLLYMHAAMMAMDLGFEMNIIQVLSPAFGLLFYYIGIVMGKVKKNWFVGIRTPWTLSSDVVWDRTHRVGGRLFRTAGLIALVGVVLPGIAIWLILVPVLLAAAYAVVYSYVQYQGLHKK